MARTEIESPAGGVELFRCLRGLAEEYKLRATAIRDYDAAAIALALEALVLHAARAGVHVHLQVVQEGT